jgi:hypothetical protein
MYIDASTTQEQWAWDFSYSSASFPQYKWKIAGTTLATLRDNGNLILSSTGTDSANGKIQLATHTTSAGGIGFGTADSLYTAGVGDLRFKTTSAEAAITLLSGGAYIGSVTAGKSTFIISGTGTTALTLDSSQNATFAGKTYTASGTAAAPALSFTGDTDSGFYNPGGNQVALACGGGQIWNTTVNGLSMASGKDIYLGNAYVAGAPTATGYVTIKDSAGNTYKVLVGT